MTRRALRLQEWRCPSCGRLIARVNRGALFVATVAAEVKCTCGRLNYLEREPTLHDETAA